MNDIETKQTITIDNQTEIQKRRIASLLGSVLVTDKVPERHHE